MATYHPVAATKRRLDDFDDCELDELRKPKTVMRKYPPPKIRIGVQVVRDFPPGCGIIHESKVERKPLKKLDNVDSSTGSFTSHGKDKMVNSHPFENSKLSSYKHKELGFNKPSLGSKPSSKVKYWDPMEQVVHDHPPVSGILEERKPMNSKPKESGLNKPSVDSIGKVQFHDPTCSKEENVLIPKDMNIVESRTRQKIFEAMILFDEVYAKKFQENKSKQNGVKIAHWIVPMEAAKIVKQKLKWMTPNKSLGQIHGVHIGDRFKYRSQLQLIGLHCQPHNGIDYTKVNGQNLALSIVDSHRYTNESGSCTDVLSYCGEGGVGGAMFGHAVGSTRQVAPPDDQKLERGNLALKNSMNEKSPVRVIKKVFGVGKKKDDLFVYDGLYTVEDFSQTRDSEGKMVFMFQLHKIPGQPQFQKKVNAIPGYSSSHYSSFQMLS